MTGLRWAPLTHLHSDGGWGPPKAHACAGRTQQWDSKGALTVSVGLSSGLQAIGPGEAEPGKRWMVFSGLTSDVLHHVHHRLNRGVHRSPLWSKGSGHRSLLFMGEWPVLEEHMGRKYCGCWETRSAHSFTAGLGAWGHWCVGQTPGVLAIPAVQPHQNSSP